MQQIQEFCQCQDTTLACAMDTEVLQMFKYTNLCTAYRSVANVQID